jgi:hypothetical protein
MMVKEAFSMSITTGMIATTRSSVAAVVRVNHPRLSSPTKVDGFDSLFHNIRHGIHFQVHCFGHPEILTTDHLHLWHHLLKFCQP